MSDLRDLYQELILDHNRNPRNFGSLAAPTNRAEGFNPLCGDKLTVSVSLDGDKISDIRFEGSGCAISKASASMMTAAVKDKTKQEAEKLFGTFHAMVTQATPDAKTLDALGKLAVFSGVREFPVRVKCASLPWHTLHAALSEGGTVSTE
jgi:nitrogen fixation NifU-like protein